ncbi:MAG: carboxylesterase family protein, partial [Acidobacteria bacterium]|nr:carboxylesterase family protein [Acidobacteriota bacterium]
PSVLFAIGKQMRVPLLLGSNADEGTMFIVPAVKASGNPQKEYENYIKSVYRQNADLALETFPVENGDVADAMNRMFTQMGFAAGARYAASCQSRDNTGAYLYRFSRRPDYPFLEMLGTCHGLEIPYIFGNFTDWFSSIGSNTIDRSLSDKMMSYWTSFARTGNPDTDGLPHWPAYKTEDGLYQNIDSPITTEANLYEDSYTLVRKVTGWRY